MNQTTVKLVTKLYQCLPLHDSKFICSTGSLLQAFDARALTVEMTKWQACSSYNTQIDKLLFAGLYNNTYGVVYTCEDSPKVIHLQQENSHFKFSDLDRYETLSIYSVDSLDNSLTITYLRQRFADAITLEKFNINLSKGDFKVQMAQSTKKLASLEILQIETWLRTYVEIDLITCMGLSREELMSTYSLKMVFYKLKDIKYLDKEHLLKQLREAYFTENEKFKEFKF